MKLIIEISDASYETVKNGTWCGSLYEELKNGIPLSESEDCVSRQAVLNLAKFDGRDGLGSIIHAFDVEQLPPVTPAEKVGHWEWNQYDSNPKIGNWHCSQCHGIGKSYYDYCPYCKAKMLASPTGAERNDKE